MRRKRTHVLVGVPADAVVAGFRARNQVPVQTPLEGIGGGLGAWLGSQAPDVPEPASLGWGHRSLYNSWSAMVLVLAATPMLIFERKGYCRTKADHLTLLRFAGHYCRSEFGRILLFLQGILWRIAAGTLAEFVAGYASHLALDSFSKSTLPVLT